MNLKKWLVPLCVTYMLVVLCVCVIGACYGIFRLVQSLPTPVPTIVLKTGNNYWVGALIPPKGLPAGLVLRYADIYNKPGHSLTDPSVTIIATVPDTTELTLVAIQKDWCYVKGTYYMSGIESHGEQVEGWMECNRLLDYKPTPYPTPNLTPQTP